MITLDPGAVVTFVAELRIAEAAAGLSLGRRTPTRTPVNSYTLYRGIVIGIAGLLALFLTILFVVKGTSMFPATAALAWAVLAYICVDFGFLNKVIDISPGSEQMWRAGTEVGLAATLRRLPVHLSQPQPLARPLQLLARWLDRSDWSLIAGVAVIDPAVAAGIARLSFAADRAIVGFGLIVYLGIHGYDRAIMLMPTWVMVLVWTFAAWLAVTGHARQRRRPAGARRRPGPDRPADRLHRHAARLCRRRAARRACSATLERQALARRPAPATSSGTGTCCATASSPARRRALQLGLAPRQRSTGPARNWLPVLHPDDRDRFRTTLDAVLEHRRGRISQDFRLRGDDGHYHWFRLRARPVLGSDGEVIRCVGTLLDVTEQKKSEERLLHDAVHDNLTGLPNRELFLTGWRRCIALAKAEDKVTAVGVRHRHRPLQAGQ